MNSFLIGMVSKPGQDPQRFRAFFDVCGQPTKGEGLNTYCSTTGHPTYAVVRCAAKAFVKFDSTSKVKPDVDEVETRIRIKPLKGVENAWRAILYPRNGGTEAQPPNNTKR